MTLYRALKERGHRVTVCAPNSQRSAASQSVTLRQPIKASPWAMPDGDLGFAISGTPADCSHLGCRALAREPVDMVVSGLNDDFNLGYDINYSGTVAAAMEAASMGYPALAASLERSRVHDWKTAAHIVIGVIDSFSSWNIAQGVAVNLNIPARLSTGRNEWFWAPPHPTASADDYEASPQPDGSALYQRRRSPAEDMASGPSPLDSDLIQARRGRITLSPLLPHGFHRGLLERLAADNRDSSEGEPGQR